MSAQPPAAAPAPKSDTIRFAHASERQFAGSSTSTRSTGTTSPPPSTSSGTRTGHVTQRFTPDFYLPAYDLYIEITTLNQKLVTKKNRKVRRLRERYPEVKCKIFYQRDYLSLVTKYGLEDASG